MKKVKNKRVYTREERAVGGAMIFIGFITASLFVTLMSVCFYLFHGIFL